MWLLFTIMSLMQYAAADIIGKKGVSEGDAFSPIELCVSCSALSVVVAIILYVFRLGESGLTPWKLLQLNPAIFINLSCFLLHWLLYLLSMKYIKLSIAEAVGATGSVFYFVGLILTNLLFGRLANVRAMLHPLRLFPIIIVIVFLCIYPYVDIIGKEQAKTAIRNIRKNNRSYRLGLGLLFAALIVDVIDSLLTALIIDNGTIGIIDYTMTTYFCTASFVLVVLLFLRIKNKEWYIPFKNNTRYAIGYSVCALTASQLFVIASFKDAVRTGILFLIFPILPIIGAKVYLKEKNTLRQNICIWVITLFAIAFCISDYFL